MMKKTQSCCIIGMNAYIITVEVDLSKGMPTFDIVGLPDTAVKESKERIRAAFKNCALEFPKGRITINLAPANLKKGGAMYDLPIACAILQATGQIQNDAIEEYLLTGELSLDGTVCPVSGVLPMLLHAKAMGLQQAIVPTANSSEAAVINDMTVYPAKKLTDVVAHFSGQSPLEAIHADLESLFSQNQNSTIDFSDVKGQEQVKRALEIAAAGGHNVLMIGSPGSGKTMLAQRLPTILPDLSFEEALEVTKIYSVAGKMDENCALIAQRPFRSPHHTISAAGLAGGGKIPKPGEISLAHHGVLFFDEFPEFSKHTLEVMRQPLEDGCVTISRANGSYTYPCNIMFVAAMNPCPCGYLHSQIKPCTCSNKQIQAYLSRISGPLLDRIDIHMEVAPVPYEELSSTTNSSETSAQIKMRVDQARQLQRKRYQNEGIYANAQLSAKLLTKYCTLDKQCQAFLKDYFEKLSLSARAYNKILKIARTIADLEGAENLSILHLAEAVQYRGLDQKYWGYGG